MNMLNSNILTINAGSSSITIALYEMRNEPILRLTTILNNSYQLLTARVYFIELKIVFACLGIGSGMAD